MRAERLKVTFQQRLVGSLWIEPSEEWVFDYAEEWLATKDY